VAHFFFVFLSWWAFSFPNGSSATVRKTLAKMINIANSQKTPCNSSHFLSKLWRKVIALTGDADGTPIFRHPNRQKESLKT
jgi:hypothetical protein